MVGQYHRPRLCRNRASVFVLVLLEPRPPGSTLFPYTTLFRSSHPHRVESELPGAEIEHALHDERARSRRDRKSTRLNSSHTVSSYAVFSLNKKTGPSSPALRAPGVGMSARPS